MEQAKPVNRTKRNQGMNWISQHKRLAIYLRDGLACMYCGLGIEDGIQLTLDHLKPHAKGGDNEANNLVTCCLSCNSSRGKRSVTSFAKTAAEYRGIDHECILRNIKNSRKKVLNIAVAKQMILERGSCAKAIQK